MLPEALNFAATYFLSPRKNATEINSSVKLWARARRVSRDWASHEENSKTFILESMGGLRQRRICVVLGSGLLRDVPIGALSRCFEQVWLYDLQHLASVRLWARAKGLTNLRFIHRDLSGIDEALAAAGGSAAPLAFLKDIAGLDMVISANLLSQLGIGISRKINAAPDRFPSDLAATLIKAHVDGLAGCGARTCLLTDTQYEIIDKAGTSRETVDLMCGVSLPAAVRQWRWTVAPMGELDPNYQAVHHVAAI